MIAKNDDLELTWKINVAAFESSEKVNKLVDLNIERFEQANFVEYLTSHLFYESYKYRDKRL